jgi:inorganic pyrophosphatase
MLKNHIILTMRLIMKPKLYFALLLIFPFLGCYAETQNPPINSSQQLSLPPSMLYRAHPWHGPSLGEKAPEVVNCYVEIVPACSIKFEMDKETGILKVDRPHKYSSFCPTLYGFLPRTYAGSRVAEFTSQKVGNPNIVGDGDALDVCILSDNTFVHGDLILKAIPIGGFRMLDNNEADDKIIAVLEGDLVFGNMKDISECPPKLLDQLRHFFLTYKEIPEKGKQPKVQIAQTYGREEALEVIHRSYKDYLDYISQYQH